MFVSMYMHTLFDYDDRSLFCSYDIISNEETKKLPLNIRKLNNSKTIKIPRRCSPKVLLDSVESRIMKIILDHSWMFDASL